MPGVAVGPGDALGTPDVAGVDWLGVAEAAVQPAGVRGSADETADAILGSGVACAVAVAAVVAGRHVDAADERGEAVPVALVPAAPPAPVVDDPPPFPAVEPLPSVPPPPDDLPAVSTLAVTCPTACRSGGTATVTIARKAIAASALAGRSQLVPVTQFVTVTHLPPGRGADRCPWRAWGRGAGEEAGQAQCPRQTQYRMRLAAPLTTLSSHG
jgi:hypothetical protein